MKITNRDILVCIPTMNKLTSAEIENPLVAFRVIKNARALSKALDDYKAFADKNKESADVLEEEIEVDIKKVKPSALGGAKLTPIDMGNILFMLEDEDELPEAQPNEAPKEHTSGVPNLPPPDTKELPNAK